jgi:transducin (beta)-like 1
LDGSEQLGYQKEFVSVAQSDTSHLTKRNRHDSACGEELSGVRSINVLLFILTQGFELSTYALQQESGAHRLDEQLSGNVPRGTLVGLVQKGIQFLEVEATVRGKKESDRSVVPFTLLSALSLATDEERNGHISPEVPPIAPPPPEPRQVPADRPPSVAKNNENGKSKPQQTTSEVQVDAILRPMTDLTVTYSNGPTQSCQWNPVLKNTVAFGTSDVHASILTVKENPELVSLAHTAVSNEEKDVTALAWNPTGTLLVTGTFDGKMRIWTNDGKLRHALSLHRAPVLVIRWNSSGSLILSVDCMNTAVIWEASTGDIKQQFQHSQSLTYDDTVTNGQLPGHFSVGNDGDWIDDLTYATTGERASIMIYKVGEQVPLLKFRGHVQGINSLQFDQATKLLASASDDYAIRIWHGKSPVSIMTLTGHTGPVMVIRWQPHSDNLASLLDPTVGRQSLLVSASVDGTVRVWNPSKGNCVAILALHDKPIFACEISSNGRYVATGGADGVLVVWDISNFKPTDEPGTPMPSANHAVARYSPDEVDATINALSWSSDMSKIFVSYSSKSVVVAFDI